MLFLHFLINYINICRNAIIVILCLVLAMILDPQATDCKENPDSCVFTLTGNIQSGLPDFKPPPFSITVNSTTTDFGGMVSQLGSAIIIIPLIAILESVAIAKAFGSNYFLLSRKYSMTFQRRASL